MKRVIIILLLFTSFPGLSQTYFTETITFKAKKYLIPPEIKSEIQKTLFRQESLPYCNLFTTDCFFNVQIIQSEDSEVYLIKLSGIPASCDNHYSCFTINGHTFFFAGYIPDYYLPTDEELSISYENYYYLLLGHKINLDSDNPQWQIKRTNNVFSIESEPPAIWPVFPMKGLKDYFKYYNSNGSSTTGEIIRWKVLYPCVTTIHRFEPLPRCRLLFYSNSRLSNNRIVSKYTVSDSSLAKDMSYLLSNRINQKEIGSFILNSKKSNHQETFSFLYERTICSKENNTYLGYFSVDGIIIYIQGCIPSFLSPSNEMDAIEVPAIKANTLSCNFFIEPSSCSSSPIMIIKSSR